MEEVNTKKLDVRKDKDILIVDYWGEDVKFSKKALKPGVWETIPDKGQVWATTIKNKIDAKSIIPTNECKITPPPKPVQQAPVSEKREIGITIAETVEKSAVSSTIQTTSLVSDKSIDLKSASSTCPFSTDSKIVIKEQKLSQDDVERIYNEIIAKADKGVKALIENEDKTRRCSICGGEVHQAMWTGMSFSTWYYLDEESNIIDIGKPTARAKLRKKELQNHIEKYGPCLCGYRAIPKEGCNVFRRKRIQGESHGNRAKFDRKRKKDKKREGTMDEMFDKASKELEKLKFPFEFDVVTDAPDTQGEHLVPLSAGGCPTSTANPYKIEDENHKFNIVKIWQLCSFCQHLDELFTEWQRENEKTVYKYYESRFEKV